MNKIFVAKCKCGHIIKRIHVPYGDDYEICGIRRQSRDLCPYCDIPESYYAGKLNRVLFDAQDNVLSGVFRQVTVKNILKRFVIGK